jgi:SAM-dependent methyltransferase
MQEWHLPARAARFDCLVRLVRAVQPDPETLLDLGCGTGSLTLRFAEAFPNARIVGLDFDATLLVLARARCAGLGERVSFADADLRSPAWTAHAPGGCAAAAVSATALHWLSRDCLRRLYADLVRVLRPGGIFLNADHVGSDLPGIQRLWQCQREEARGPAGTGGEDYDEFWRAYLAVLGTEAAARREAALGPWEGIEPGLPLWWHLDTLRAAGFEGVDCFWRHAGDAIYGGVKGAQGGRNG